MRFGPVRFGLVLSFLILCPPSFACCWSGCHSYIRLLWEEVLGAVWLSFRFSAAFSGIATFSRIHINTTRRASFTSSEERTKTCSFSTTTTLCLLSRQTPMEILKMWRSIFNKTKHRSLHVLCTPCISTMPPNNIYGLLLILHFPGELFPFHLPSLNKIFNANPWCIIPHSFVRASWKTWGSRGWFASGLTWTPRWKVIWILLDSADSNIVTSTDCPMNGGNYFWALKCSLLHRILVIKVTAVNQLFSYMLGFEEHGR